LRARLRSLALDALSAVPRRPKPGVRIVVYHWVHDHERDAFARQLAWLARTYEPVSYPEAVARVREGRVGGREVAVTFDDGFRSGLTNAAPLLAEHGFRACFFPITELVSAPPDVVARVCRETLHLDRPLEPLSWAELGRLVELGHEVGAHTLTHPNLVAAGPEELREEVEGSRDELAARLGSPPEHFAAPYGDRARFSPAVSAAARAAGFASCASAIRGRNAVGADVYALRRDNAVASWPVRHLRWFLASG
jgi:peptidoglycan/xylan/chitin deacetylase (PgdA/CDA1 family)